MCVQNHRVYRTKTELLDVFFSTDISFATMAIVVITVDDIVFSVRQLVVVKQFPAMCV